MKRRRYFNPMNMQEILNRIDERLAATGLSDAKASSMATGSKDTIRNWRRAIDRGQEPGATIGSLGKLADVLQCQLPWLVGGSLDTSENVSLRTVTVAAHVQAGQFAEAWEWNEGDQYPVAVPADPSLEGFKLYAAETRGPSMNRRWPEGTVVVFTNVVETGEMPTKGRRYVVERRRLGGDAEHTVKLLVQDADGKYWLMPESDDPRFQAPISVDEGTGDGDVVTIIGRVRYAVSRE